LSNGAKVRAAGIPTFHVKYRPTFLYDVKHDLIGPRTYLKGRKVVAFAGLGDNRSFFELLRELGAELIHEVEFPDHHAYGARDMERLSSLNGAGMLITTEKDAIKLDQLEIPEGLFYLAVEAVVEREEELVRLIVKRLRGRDVDKDPHI
jgi:tetraacyldisaccharide 4'-kinase